MSKHQECSHHICAHDTDISKISKVLVLILIFMLLELWGHYRTKSLSLLADALHLLVDISGFIVSLVALHLAKRGENNKMTWGYQRMEIIGAMFSVLLIWTAVGYLMLESFHKYAHPQEIDGKMFLGIAVIGFLVNCCCLYVLHFDEYHDETQPRNLNIRATYVHVIGDVVQSAGVILASGLIFLYPAFVLADVICTLIFALLVLSSTFYVMRDGIHILAEGAPPDIDQDAIRQFVLSEPAVVRISDMKLWVPSINRNAIILTVLTDHLMIKEYEALLQKIRTYLKDELRFDTINIQIDTPRTTAHQSGFEVGGVAVPNSVVLKT